jgi:uncharacterized protein YoxC
MQKLKAKILTAIIVATIALAAFPLMAFASTGYIRVNIAAPAPSPVGQTVPAGGNVNLNFGGVTWSGGQFYLIWSTNGFSDSTGTPYSPTFDLVNLTETGFASTYTNALGSWTIGSNWVNGSIPLNIAGGPYFIKAFDGLSTAVAVTDTAIIVTGTFQVVPTSGPAGAALTLQAFAFAANAVANITYYNTTGTNLIPIADLIQADALGQFNYSLTAPDLKQMVSPAGDQPVVPTPIIFNAKYVAGDGYNATYNENPRGLKQIKSNIAAGLYGNGTDLTISGQVGDTVRYAGYNFYPGTVNFLWDGITIINSTTANGTGYFNTTITIPLAAVGPHVLVIQDAGVSFYTVVSVTPTLILTPSSGPIGTTVTVAGIGFPASAGTVVHNVTLTWSFYNTTTGVVGWALTDATGQFTTTFVVPKDSGGNHAVTATANNTGTPVTSSKNFKVTPLLTVTPSSFANDPTVTVTAKGTGFDPTVYYMPNIDNVLLGVNGAGGLYQTGVLPTTSGNNVGDLTVSWVGVGFSYGMHVFSLYGQSNTPTVFATFNVTLTTGDPTVDLLKQINQTVTGLSGLAGVNATLLTGISNGVATLVTNMGVVQTKLDAINATLIAINGNVATLSTNVGIIRANVTTITPMITTINTGIATVQTAVGTLQTTVSSLSGTLTSISGTVGTISTSVGTISSDLDSIGTKVTSIDGKTATIQTDLGTLSGTVTSTDGKVATIQTAIGTLQADVTGLKTSVADVPNQVSGQLSIPIWIAVVLALIAAIGAIASLLLVRRKIAG